MYVLYKSMRLFSHISDVVACTHPATHLKRGFYSSVLSARLQKKDTLWHQSVSKNSHPW